MSHYCRNYAWERFGIDLVIGWAADTVIDLRQQMFIPMLLMQALDSATVSLNDSSTLPLVKEHRLMVDASEDGLVLPPTPWWQSPIALAFIVLILALAISIHDLRHRHVSRWFDTLLFTIYGLAGCVIGFLICFSTHEATSPNINIVWLHPLLLLIAMLPWITHTQTIAWWLHLLNAIAVALLILLWPWQPQVANIAFFPLMIASVVRSASYVLITRQQTRAPDQKG